MKKSILVLVFVLVLLLSELSFAKLVSDQWCFKCPPNTALTLFERDRYYCMIPGTNQSAGVPLWAKPNWAKVVWDVRGGRCITGYTRFGDLCYQCPKGYQFTTAVTDQRRQVPTNDLIGSWVGCDGREVTFTLEGGEYVGRYTKLGGLRAYHFKVNEIGYRAKRNVAGEYVGKVKWRWTSDKVKWVPNTITINGNKYTDSGSDSCSRTMDRVNRP